MDTYNLRNRALRIYRVQGTGNPVLEVRRFYLYISGIAYVKNSQPIYIKGIKGSMRKYHKYFFEKSLEDIQKRGYR